MSRVLVTGGAGFIGSHVADDLLRQGNDVRVLDNLTPQVHEGGNRPAYLSHDVELIHGDVRDRAAVRSALQGVDQVIHLAARVGVGQSMYEIEEYMSANTTGTAALLQELLDHPVERLVVASSMSIYGEGLYESEAGTLTPAVERSRSQMAAGEWDPRGPNDEVLRPVATTEDKAPSLSSVYALGKYDQERLSLLFGNAYDIPTVALRFFNVYGPNQALSNPYTGVLAIFAARLLNERAPMIFEDGEQKRDFVWVSDVARACRLALQKDEAAGHAINIGSGESVTVNDIASKLAAILGKDLQAEVTGKYRVGDIRHCFADISLARKLLDYEPEMTLDQGMREIAEWLADQTAEDRVDAATAELASRGLTR